MSNKFIIFSILLLFVFSCKKKEYAEMHTFFNNITTDTIVLRKYKSDLIYNDTIPPDTCHWFDICIYGDYTPANLAKTKFDSILIIYKDTTITYKHNDTINNSPFNNNYWHFIESYEDSRCSSRCKHFTVYKYYYNIEKLKFNTNELFITKKS